MLISRLYFTFTLTYCTLHGLWGGLWGVVDAPKKRIIKKELKRKKIKMKRSGIELVLMTCIFQACSDLAFYLRFLGGIPKRYRYMDTLSSWNFSGMGLGWCFDVLMFWCCIGYATKSADCSLSSDCSHRYRHQWFLCATEAVDAKSINDYNNFLWFDGLNHTMALPQNLRTHYWVSSMHSWQYAI